MRYFFLALGILLYCPISEASESANYSQHWCDTKSNDLPPSNYERWKNSPLTAASINEIYIAAKVSVQQGQCQQAAKLYTLILNNGDQSALIKDDFRFEVTTKLILVYLAQTKYLDIGPVLPKWLELRQHETTIQNSELGMAYYAVSEYYFQKDEFPQAEKFVLLAIKNVEVDQRFFTGMPLHDQLRAIYDHLASIYYRERRFSEGEIARNKELRDPSKNYITTVRQENAAEKKERQRNDIIKLFSKGSEQDAITRFKSLYELAVDEEATARQTANEKQEQLKNLLQQESNLTPASMSIKDVLNPSKEAEKKISLGRDILKLKQSIREQETQILRKVLSVTNSAFDLAEAYHQQKNYVNAEQLYKVSIEKSRILRLNKQEIESIASLGILYRALGRYQESETMLRTALASLRNNYGALHPDVLEAENELAFVLHQQKNYLEAKTLYLSHLSICETSPQPVADDIARIQLTLGDIDLAQGQVNDAKNWYERAIAPYQNKNEQNPILREGLKRLADLNSQTNDAENLKKNSKKSKK